MKKSYTEYVSPLHKEAKKHGASPAAMVDYLEQQLTAKPDNKELKNAVRQAKLMLAYEQGECVHLFLPGDGFAGWLADCAKTLQPEAVDIVGKAFATIVCVHFPTSEHRESFVFIACTIVNKPGFFVIPSVGCAKPIGTFGLLFDGQSSGLWEASTPENTEKYEPDHGFIVETQKLIAGLALYMSAFPEQVKDGLPSDLNKPNHFRTFASKTFGVSDKVRPAEDGGHHSGPRPHYRTGHFCVYTSERYTEMRGQVRFRHGCFVAGAAKTVEGI